MKCELGAASGAESNEYAEPVNLSFDPEDEVLCEVTSLGPRTHISLGHFPEKAMPMVIRALEKAFYDDPKESSKAVDIGFQFSLGYNWDLSPGLGEAQGMDHILNLRSTDR